MFGGTISNLLLNLYVINGIYNYLWNSNVLLNVKQFDILLVILKKKKGRRKIEENDFSICSCFCNLATET